MGSEDLHHKRKRQTNDSLRRKVSIREPYDVILVACEGEKTEPNYFNDFRLELKLNPENIKIRGLGVDPLTVVEHAVEEFNKHKGYDRVYCVFDKDQHSSYETAINKINSLRENIEDPIPIYAANSVPSFEYWILLHFEDTRRPYATKQLLCDLKKHIKDYKKGSKDIFEKTKHNLRTAIKRAKKYHQQQGDDGTDNPSTKVHELIEYLLEIDKNRS